MMIDNQVRSVIYGRFNVDAYLDPFSFDMIGWNMVAMAIEGVLFLIIAIWLDAKCCCKKYVLFLTFKFLFIIFCIVLSCKNDVTVTVEF